MKVQQVSVTDVETLVVDAKHGPKGVVLRVPGALSTAAYVGPSGVTDSDGFAISADGTAIPLDVPHGEKLYAVCAPAASTTLHVYEA